MLTFVLRTLDELRAEFQNVRNFLDQNEIGEENVYDVRLTIFELCGNILQHSKCPCRVTLELSDSVISIRIESDVAFRIHEACGTTFSERGRGVFLVKNLVRSLQYYDSGKNIVAEIDRC